MRGIVKTSGSLKVLAGIDLTVARGECVVLSSSRARLQPGERSAGLQPWPDPDARSTLLRIAATLVAPSSGSIEIDGADAHTGLLAARKRIAFADGWIAPGDELFASEYLRFAAGPMTKAASEAAVRRSGVDPGAPLSSLNAGQRRTLAAACALASGKDVVLLDEPFTDASRSLLVEWIEEIARAGSAVIVASNCATLDARGFALADGRLVSVPGLNARTSAGAAP